jgi:glycosyltransferase involved in cell wall biosynthesis
MVSSEQTEGDREMTKGGRIRILFYVWADEDNTNAQSLNARDIALRLDPDRFHSALFARRPDHRLVEQPGITVVRLPPRLRSAQMARHLIWRRYDLAVYPSGRTYSLYRALGPMARKKRIVQPVEGTVQSILRYSSGNRIMRELGEADARFAISEFIAENLHASHGMDCVVLPLGVDTKRFHPLGASGDRSSLPVRILCVASLQPGKRIQVLLDFAHRVPPSAAEFHIVGGVIGSPAYRRSLLLRRDAEGLTHVSFHPPVSQAEVSRLMQQSDIFILPSRLEGVPKVTLEAAASGLPCLVFDDYRTPSVIDGVTGFQVKTEEEMLARLELLIDRSDLRARMGAEAVAHASQYDWNLVAKEWEGALGHVAET